MDQHFRGGLACCVGIRWSQDAGLKQIIRVISDLSIDLVGGDVDELLDADLLCALQQNVSSVDVRMCEGVGVSEAQINVRLCSKVEDSINLMSLQTVHDLGGVRDIAMVECEVALVVQDSSVVQGRAVVELIEGHDIVCIRIGQGQMSYKPAGTVEISTGMHVVAQQRTYMKPAPPVIMIFLTSGRGSYFVLPVKTGASFHTPKSSKNLLV